MKLTIFISLILLFIINNVLASQYLVIFQKGDRTPSTRINNVKSVLTDFGGKITYEYSNILTGFTVELPDDLIISFESKISDADWPDFIEKDSTVTAL